MTNPLLEMLESGELPPFDRIHPEHAEPALDHVLAENRAAIDRLAHCHTWDTLAEPSDAMDDRLERLFAPISHLNGVMNSPAWREAYNACVEKLSAYATEVGQNRELYDAWHALSESGEYGTLDATQQKLVDDTLRDFRLSGVALDADKKARFKEIAQRLSRLSTQFEENLLDATQAWQKQITDEDDLEGLPESARALAREKAREKEKEGWLLTLDIPSFLAVIRYSARRELREEIYRAFTTRASDTGPDAGRWDNSAIMDEILALRHEQSQLVGFDNYAEYSLATKMADNPAQVIDFLEDLARRSLPAGQRELEELQDFARERDGLETLQSWDTAYYSEQLKRQLHDLSDEDLRPYFPAPQVIDGLFKVVHRLYGLDIRPEPDAPVWHPDVRVYAIRDREGNERSRFYLDLYARENKRGGAWMADCVSHRRTPTGIQKPVAFVTCNFAPAVGGEPALLTHDEVITLFHEFGHSLHHMLTRVDYSALSGIAGVPWDAVELPSQFMENWCWEREALDLFAAHYKTGEALPQDLYERMHGARNYHSAMAMLRQLEFSLFDFRLHRDFDPARGARVRETLDSVRNQVALLPPPEFNRFAHTFAHIFAGGYAAGYYSYKWAELLSADAFSAFEETSLFDPQTGERFLTSILEMGGSRDAMELFKTFRGREPSLEPLLRHSGLDSDQAA